MSDKNLQFETLQLRAGYNPLEHNYACAVPIYQTASFNIGDTARHARLKKKEEKGFFYTRSGNPTIDVLEQRIAALEGGTAALAVASGMAAVAYSILNVAEGGGEIVASPALYAGSFNLLKHTLTKFGIKVNWVEESENPESYRKAITPNTKAIFAETIGNPKINVLDIEAVAKIAHENNIPLIVDNTIATPFLLKPFDYGADIVVYSSTKAIAGHGTTLAGLIVENGRFAWDNGKFEHFIAPDYKIDNQSLFNNFPNAVFTTRVRLHYLSEFGAVISPFDSFLVLQGIETLAVRVSQEVKNTEAIVEYLLKHPQVEWVNYPSVNDEKSIKVYKKYLTKGAGSVLYFGYKGKQREINKFIDSLKVFNFLVNIGDAKSLIIQPYEATHASLSSEDKVKAGVYDNGLRLSVGLENVTDLINDLDQAFAIAKNA